MREWERVKTSEKGHADGQPAHVERLRLPAAFYRVVAEPSTNSIDEPVEGFTLSTGSGSEMGELCAEIAQAASEGMVGIDKTPAEKAAPALLSALLDMLDCLETEIECGDAFPYTAKIERAWESVRQARGEEAGS